MLTRAVEMQTVCWLTVDLAPFLVCVSLLQTLSVQKEALVSGGAVIHQLQVQKIISHFQALLFSHSGCLFSTKTK